VSAPNSALIAAGVRCVATEHGAILATARGHFSLDRPSRSALWDELPRLMGRPVPAASASETVDQALGSIGALRGIGELPLSETGLPISCVRELSIEGSEPFAAALSQLLESRVPLERVDQNHAATIVVERSATHPEASDDRLRDLHMAGKTCWLIARMGGEEVLIARLVPGQSLCWDCLLHRAGMPQHNPQAQPWDAATLQALADNLWLESAYPSLLDSQVIIVNERGRSTTHRALPVPGCPLCSTTMANAANTKAPRHDPWVPDELTGLADSRFGVLREIVIFQPTDDAYPTLPCCASASIALPDLDGGITMLRGEGKGVTEEAAVLGAIGEGIERYAACAAFAASPLWAALSDHPNEMFDPRWLVLYDDEQYATAGFPYRRFEPDRPMPWVQGVWLDDGRAVWLPTEAVYLRNNEPPCGHFAQTTSNGLATGQGFDDAALRAVYELIERDAFMRFWMTSSPRWRLADAGNDPQVRRAMSDLARQGAELELYLLDDYTGHATVLCMGCGDGVHWPGVTVGLGTHASLDVAIRKAVFEHSHYGLYMQRLMREDRHAAVLHPQDVRSNLDHGLFYVHAEHRCHVDRVAASATSITFERAAQRFQLPATLNACIQRLAACDIRVAAVDITPADIAQTPYRVVRALATYLQPIHFGAGFERRANPRIAIEPGRIPHPLA